MWLVDPWTRQPDKVYRESTNQDADFNSWYDACAAWAGTTSGRVGIIRKLSVEAAKHFGEAVLDWVYIDGNHSYEAVVDDIHAWLPKLKPGGLIGGHDYLNDTATKGWHCEVKRAVDELLRDVHTTPCSSWWAIKT